MWWTHLWLPARGRCRKGAERRHRSAPFPLRSLLPEDGRGVSPRVPPQPTGSPPFTEPLPLRRTPRRHFAHVAGPGALLQPRRGRARSVRARRGGDRSGTAAEQRRRSPRGRAERPSRRDGGADRGSARTAPAGRGRPLAAAPPHGAPPAGGERGKAAAEPQRAQEVPGKREWKSAGRNDGVTAWQVMERERDGEAQRMQKPYLRSFSHLCSTVARGRMALLVGRRKDGAEPPKSRPQHGRPEGTCQWPPGERNSARNDNTWKKSFISQCFSTVNTVLLLHQVAKKNSPPFPFSTATIFTGRFQ